MPIFTPELIARYAQQIQAEPAPTLGTIGDRPSHAALHRLGLPVMIGGQAADLATTLQALHSGRGQEQNRLLGSSVAQIAATKAGATALAAWLLDRKASKEHPKAALAAMLTLGAIGAGLAAHNAQVGK